MKHAFIFGTNLYLTAGNTVTYADQDHKIDFLKIYSFYRPERNQELVIEAKISLPHNGGLLTIDRNKVNATGDIRTIITPNRIKIYHEGHTEPIFDVYQIDQHEWGGLSSHVLNEFNSQHPDVLIRVKGEFEVEGNSIISDNEKLYVNGDSRANGVSNEHERVILTPDNVHMHA